MIKIVAILLSFAFSMQKGCDQKKPFDCTTCSSNDSIVKKINKMNFEKYQTKEVGVFLDNLNFAYTEYIPIQKKPGYIYSIMFVYSDSSTLEIRVSDLKQEQPLYYGYTFDINEFKKKKIEMLCFRYAGRCIKGCQGQLCPD